MYLKKTPTKSGRVSLSAVHNYRDEQGKNRQRTIKTFGFVDELAKEFDDPVAHFRSVVAEMDAERLREEAPAAITVHLRQKVSFYAQFRHKGGKIAVFLISLAALFALGAEGIVA